MTADLPLERDLIPIPVERLIEDLRWLDNDAPPLIDGWGRNRCKWAADVLSALIAKARSPASQGVDREAASEHRIYVASRASKPDHPKRWRLWRDAGWPIISTWIDEAGEGQTPDNGELWQRIKREVTTATALILHIEPDDFPLKGAFVEVGLALAAGVPIGVVAPDIELEPHSCRPIGSWMHHPLVRVYPSLLAAFDAATTGYMANVRATFAGALAKSDEIIGLGKEGAN